MSDDTKTVTISKKRIEPARDVPHAPFLFFDSVATSGIMNGLVTVTLLAGGMLPDENEAGVIVTSPVVTAHLRTNTLGAIALRDALNTALAMAQTASVGPTQGSAN